MFAHAVGLIPLLVTDNDEHKERFYRQTTKDRAVAAFVLMEPEAGIS
jgi:alkylation response protein AidB-like acyl-CoA dehydrogenase